MDAKCQKLLNDIKEKLIKLKEIGKFYWDQVKNQKNFIGKYYWGPKGHGYELITPANEEEIKAFEKKYKIDLPSEFRDFKKLMGNGGAGPGYGILSLREIEICLDYGDKEVLTKEFPVEEVLEVAQEYKPVQKNGQIIYKMLPEKYEGTDFLFQGAMPICHTGCGAYYYLIITSSERGNIWLNVDHGIIPFSTKEMTRYTFLEWYLHWINEFETELEEQNALLKKALKGKEKPGE